MTVDDEPTSRSEQLRRVPLPVWVALGVAAVIALASLMVIDHRPGVPTLVPGQKGPARMSTVIWTAAPFRSDGGSGARGPGQGRNAAG
jgi:hypothetical protein